MSTSIAIKRETERARTGVYVSACVNTASGHAVRTPTECACGCAYVTDTCARMRASAREDTQPTCDIPQKLNSCFCTCACVFLDVIVRWCWHVRVCVYMRVASMLNVLTLWQGTTLIFVLKRFANVLTSFAGTIWTFARALYQ